MFSLFVCFATVSGYFLCGGHTSYKGTYLEYAHLAGHARVHSFIWKKRVPFLLEQTAGYTYVPETHMQVKFKKLSPYSITIFYYYSKKKLLLNPI